MPWFAHIWLCGCFAFVYRSYRKRFAKLALHMDTAFYVPNHAVVSQRYVPFRGWNTRFSGGSRLLPEFIHTRIFLAQGATGYAAAFRELYTALALSAALATGFVALALLQDVAAAWLAMVATAMLLAESQYGGYFESAEAFEVALQPIALALIVAGLQGASAWICVGLGLLWLDVLLVKLTGALPALLVSCCVLWLQPSLAFPVLAIAALSVLGYATLIRASGVGFRELFANLRLHEVHIRQRYRNPLKLLAVKLAFALRLALYNPAIPLLASLGAWHFRGVIAHDRQPALLVCAAFALALVSAMLQQGNRVWYYLLVLLPALGTCAAAGYVWLADTLGPRTAAVSVALLFAASWARNLLQLRGPDRLLASRRVWSVYNRRGAALGDAFGDANAAVAAACEHWRARVVGSSLLVLGRHNQAYVLLEAAFDTPLVSVCALAKGVAGELRAWFPERVPESLPQWLFDSEHAFETSATWLPWLLDYELVDEHGPTRLFKRRAHAATSS